jgi:hypothetical protein
MKNTLLILFILVSLIGEAQFVNELALDSNIYGANINDIEMADMNNDGFLDVILANQTPNSGVSIYLNNTIGGFATENSITTNSFVHKATNVGDFDLDGWMDIVAVSQGGQLTVYKSNAGFSYSQVNIGTGLLSPSDVKTADFNQDGWLDFVTVSGMSIDVFMNDSTGNFTQINVDDSTEYYCICTGDLNGDGYADIISGSGVIFTYINDGYGSFTRDTTNEMLVISIITETELADIDSDGDLDLVLYYSNVVDKVDWFRNNGSGALTLASTITSWANNIHDMSIGDIDGDNDPDLCLAYDQTSDLVWISNLGNGVFCELSIDSNVFYPKETALGDLDNDGDLDLCFTKNNGAFYYLNQSLIAGIEVENSSTFSWFPNPSSGNLAIESSTQGTLYIYDISGQLVMLNELNSGDSNIKLNLANGQYILRFINTYGISTSQLIISK